MAERTARLVARVEPALLRQVKAAAKAADLSVEQWLRRLVKAALESK